jgi:putative flavoprotein involved in K+ transport
MGAAASLDVIVIGAGQAGLVSGLFLTQTGLRFRLYDRVHRIGESWRRRYDSLALFSTRSYSSLPGQSMAGDPEGYPTKDETADYLERCARSHALPVALGQGIARLELCSDGFSALTDGGRCVSGRAVIVATGAFQRSVVPSFAKAVSEHVVQLTAQTYRNPSQVPEGRVLVVGGGATGRQIARELCLRSRQVSLAVGRSFDITPQRVLGRDVMAWFDMLGFLRADKATAKGRFARAHESFPGWHLRSSALRRHGVDVRPRVLDARRSLLLRQRGVRSIRFRDLGGRVSR